MRHVLIVACFLGMTASLSSAEAQASVRQGTTSGELAADVDALRTANARLGARITGLESDKASLSGQLETLEFLLSQSRDEINRMQEDDAEIGRLISRLEDKLDAQDAQIEALQDQLEAVRAGSNGASDARIVQQSQVEIIDQAEVASTNVVSTGGPTRIVRPSGETETGLSDTETVDFAQVQTTALPQGTLGTIPASALPGEAGPLFAEAKSRLLQFDYAGAEEAFAAFLTQFGDDPQAGEAQYWLGEVLYQQEEYAASGQAYTKMIREYPEDPRAPEALAKLARSLRLVGDVERACNALNLLAQEYPDAPGVTRNLAAGERLRSDCDS